MGNLPSFIKTPTNPQPPVQYVSPPQVQYVQPPQVQYVQPRPVQYVNSPPIRPSFNQSSNLPATNWTSSQKQITLSQPNLTNVNMYNNPLQQYFIVVDTNALNNCILSAGNKNNLNINNCVLSYIKGTNKIDDSTTQIVNLVSNNPNKSSELTTNLSQNDINNISGTNLTAFSINTNNQFNNIKVNLQGLQQSIYSGDINTALINNVYGYDNSSNQFKNIAVFGSNYTVDSTGNLSSYQHFQNVEHNNKNTEYTTVIFIICIVLYLVVMTSK